MVQHDVSKQELSLETCVTFDYAQEVAHEHGIESWKAKRLMLSVSVTPDNPITFDKEFVVLSTMEPAEARDAVREALRKDSPNHSINSHGVVRGKIP
jgi:hypothetical protein